MRKWFVQSSGLSDENTFKVMDACLKLGIAYQPIGLIPFTERITGFSFDEPKESPIFYGSTKLVDIISRTAFWRHNLFYDPDTFNVRAWINSRGKEMLNGEPMIMKLSDLLWNLSLPHSDWSEFFIRPVKDLKEFSGEVITRENLKEWYDKRSYGGETFNWETMVAVSKAQDIFAEWRFFIVGGAVITGSQYKRNGRLSPMAEVPDEIFRAAEDFAKGWLPHQNVVMDVALTCDDYIKIIEFNCLNASGFYKADVEKVVKAVTESSE